MRRDYNIYTMRPLLFRTLILLALLGLIAAPAFLTARADIRRAAVNFDVENYSLAAAQYEHAARLMFWRADLWEAAGLSAFAGGDMPEAARLLTRASNLSAQGWATLAQAHYQLGQVDDAAHALERGLSEYGPTAQLYYGQFLIYNAQGNAAQETLALKNYLNFAPEDAAAHYRFGLLLSLSVPDRAIFELLTAAQLNADYDPAAQTMRTALNLAFVEPDESRRLVISGRGLGLVQEWLLAHEAFLRATKADSQNAEAWAWLGEANQHLGQDGRAELETAEALAPFSSNVRALFGLYWKRQNEPARALAEFQWAALIQPENPAMQAALGDAYAFAGDLPPALAAYQRATQLTPQDAAYWRALATFCAQYGYQVFDVGLPAAQQVLALEAGTAASHDLLGWVYLAADLPVAAEVSLLAALRTDPDFASAHLHMGMVYLKRADWLNARKHLERALELATGTPIGEAAARLLAEYFP